MRFACRRTRGARGPRVLQGSIQAPVSPTPSLFVLNCHVQYLEFFSLSLPPPKGRTPVDLRSSPGSSMENNDLKTSCLRSGSCSVSGKVFCSFDPRPTQVLEGSRRQSSSKIYDIVAIGGDFKPQRNAKTATTKTVGDEF